MLGKKFTKTALAGGAALSLAVAALALPGTSQAGSNPYLGEIQYIGYNFAPRGWSFCDGNLLPIASNTALFSLMGTIYGGDGETTFALPDMRGRAPVHVGNGPGLSNYPQGAKGGQETVTLTVAQMPSHTHSLSATSSRGNKATPANGAFAQDNREEQYHTTEAPNVAMHGNTIGATGGSQSHENRMPYLAVYCTIALVGIFPSPP